MFAGLLKNLLSDDTRALAPTDARIAMSALLVRVARSDGDYSAQEKQRIDRILAARYSLSPFEATKLRSDAETLEGEAPDTVRFTRAIKDSVPYEDRTAVIEALWSVVLTDGIRDEEEDSLLRMVAHFLGVNDRDSNLARLRVEEAAKSGE